MNPYALWALAPQSKNQFITMYCGSLNRWFQSTPCIAEYPRLLHDRYKTVTLFRCTENIEASVEPIRYTWPPSIFPTAYSKTSGEPADLAW